MRQPATRHRSSYFAGLIAVACATAFTSDLRAQEAALYQATKATVVRTAPPSPSAATPAVGQIAAGSTVEVLARDRDWVRVRLEGWVRESDLLLADSALRPLSAADIRSDPAAAKGKLVRWEVQIVALQTADPLRPALAPGEPYLLALGPGPERTLAYLAVPPSLMQVARNIPPMTTAIVTARIRDGRSEPAGVPILDLQSLTRQ